MDPSYNSSNSGQPIISSGSIPPTAPAMSPTPPMTPVQPPISSGTGDIILTPSAKPKKSKKLLFIILILTIVLALAGVAVWLVINNNNTPSLETVKKDFAAFENLLTKGDANSQSESTTETSEWYIGEIDGREGADYFVQLDKAFNEFAGNFSKIHSSEDGVSRLQDKLQNFREFYAAFSAYYTKDLDYEPQAMLKNYSNDIVNNFISNITKYRTIMKDTHSIYAKHGCYQESGSLDSDCIFGIAGEDGDSLMKDSEQATALLKIINLQSITIEQIFYNQVAAYHQVIGSK